MRFLATLAVSAAFASAPFAARGDGLPADPGPAPDGTPSAAERAQAARVEAKRAMERLERAVRDLDEAKARHEKVLAEARAAQIAADIECARAAKEDGMWEDCLSIAGKALTWDPGNEEAAALKAEAEKVLGSAAGSGEGSGAASIGGAGAEAGARMVVDVGGVSVPMRWCPPGSFTMGSPSSEEGRDADETPHRVTISKGFWLGETEVTQELWKKVLNDNPSYFKSGDDYPAESVSWHDCRAFMEQLAALAPVEGFRWTFPTEAQWEYACRAGTTSSLPNGEDVRILGLHNVPALDGIGWYAGNSCVGWDGGSKGYDVSGWRQKQYAGIRAGTHPVARKAANAWGLHDMIGNVWEWCADWYGEYPSGDVADPAGAPRGSSRIARGGAWRGNGRYCRPAYRDDYNPSYRFNVLGLRLALVPDP